MKVNGTLGVSGISVADPSFPTGDNVSLALAAANGTVTLSTSVAAGVTTSQVAGNGTSSVTITSPLAAINATLAATSGLTYMPSNGFNGTDTLTLSASDTLGNSASNSFTVAVGLTISVPSAETLKVNSSQDISGVSLSDVGLSTTDNLTVTLAAMHGIGTVSTTVTGGITNLQVTGNGTASVTIMAPLAALNATLAASGGLSYTPINGFHGSDTLSISAGDILGGRNSSTVSLLVVGPLTIAAPATAQVVKANGTIGVSGISLTDPSLPASNNVTLNLAVADGTVTLSTAVAGGITSSQLTGNGTSSVTITAAVGRDQCHARRHEWPKLHAHQCF